MAFELERFISDCRGALNEASSHAAVREVVARGVSDSGALLRTLGEPERAGMQELYRSEGLTILNVVWAPWMTLRPHNHEMWAVIGIYTGREDNIFWRVLPGRRVEAFGAKALSEGEALPLGEKVVHSVNNPIPRLTGALHVYGGDFFRVARSEWDPETLLEEPSDGEKMRRRFEEANALLLRA